MWLGGSQANQLAVNQEGVKKEIHHTILGDKHFSNKIQKIRQNPERKSCIKIFIFFETFFSNPFSKKVIGIINQHFRNAGRNEQSGTRFNGP